MPLSKLLASFVACAAIFAVGHQGRAEIRHRFVCVDNGKNRLLCVDQREPARSWSVAVPPGSRDLQRLDDGRLLVSYGNGAAEYDLATGRRLEWGVDRYEGIFSAQRLPSGNTLLGTNSAAGVVVYEVDRAGKEIGKRLLPGLKDFRLLRSLDSGHLLLTVAGPYRAVEVDPQGRIVWQAPIPDKGYKAVRLAGGNTLVSTGGAVAVLEFDRSGKVVRTAGGKRDHPDLGLDWFSGFDLLPNGNIVAANWLGHGKQGKGPHLVEFDRENRLVWKWEDHQQAATVTNVLVLDDVTPSEPAKAARPPIRGILYNEDDSHRFTMDPPGVMKPERLDQLVDELADSQVTAMLICCNAQNTAYDSRAWDPQCKGFDPAKDDRQPYFGEIPKEDRPGFRQWAHNQRRMFELGVDPMQRMIDRCRQRRISPWISVRMNDVHDVQHPSSPIHSRFWRERPDCWRYPDRFRAWNDRCLNYGMKPVRDNMMALLRELCDRYDMDGLELDWNRFPLHFREGEEIEQGKALTQWMGEVRRVVREAERKRGHAIWLVARVPARPEVACGTGLDAIAWARQGLVDHLVVAPFWATTDFDIPVERWLELLKGTGVGVTAGLEVRVQPHPGAATLENTPERRRGAAMAALARGSQGIYVFNYFDVGSQMPQLLKEMHSVETLAGKDRRYVITYTDIAVPGKPIPAPLPKRVAPGQSAEFSLFVGPKPLPGATGEVELTLTPDKPGDKPTATVRLNGRPGDGGGATFGPGAFQEGYNAIQIVNAGPSPMTVERVELALRFPAEK